MYHNYDNSNMFFTVTPNSRLTLMTGIQFDQYFAKIEETDKEGFNKTVEVREKDKNVILEAAKREADKVSPQPPPPEIYKTEKVVGKGKWKRAPKTQNVFGE